MKKIYIIKKRSFGFTMGWVLFGVCLFTLLLYGLSSFLSEPTVETITTNAPIISNTNNSNLMRDIRFQPKEKFRRR